MWYKYLSIWINQSRKNVVLGLLGSTLDSGFGPKRWNRWRPTIGLCQQEELTVDRFELLYEARFEELCQRVVEDLHWISPEMEVQPHCLPISDAWDFEDVYAALHDFARGYAFDLDAEQYLVHISTGSHVEQICLFLLTESRYLPARLMQTSPPRKGRARFRRASDHRSRSLEVRSAGVAVRAGAAQRAPRFSSRASRRATKASIG